MFEMFHKRTPHFTLAARGNYLLFLCCLLPGLFALLYSQMLVSQVPMADQLDTPGAALQMLHEGDPDWSALLNAQHNESRKLFTGLLWIAPKLLMGSWSTNLEIFMTWCCVALIVFFLWRMIQRTSDCPDRFKLPLFLFANILVFSFASWDYWIWSLSVEAYLSTLVLVILIDLSSRGTLRPSFWIVASVLVPLAVYSYANGLFLIPIVAYIAVIDFWTRPRKGKISAALAAAFSLYVLVVLWCVYFYFNNYTSPAHHPGIASGLAKPFESLVFFARWCAAPLTKSTTLATTVGFFLLIGIAVTLVSRGYDFFKSRSISSFSIWSPLLVFICISGLVTSLGRVEMGHFHWKTSRYICFSAFGIVALMPLLFATLRDIRSPFSVAFENVLDRLRLSWVKGRLLMVLIGVMSGFSIEMSVDGLEQMYRVKERSERTEAQLALEAASIPVSPDLPLLGEVDVSSRFWQRLCWLADNDYIQLQSVPVLDSLNSVQTSERIYEMIEADSELVWSVALEEADTQIVIAYCADESNAVNALMAMLPSRVIPESISIDRDMNPKPRRWYLSLPRARYQGMDPTQIQLAAWNYADGSIASLPR